MYQQPCYCRHDEKLRTGTNQHVKRPLCQDAEIVGGECQPHGEHDDAENDGLGCATHPVEEMWEKEGDECHAYDKY